MFFYDTMLIVHSRNLLLYVLDQKNNALHVCQDQLIKLLVLIRSNLLHVKYTQSLNES